MPQGVCQRCGAVYYGWALKQQEHRICQCGGEIKVRETAKVVGEAKLG